MRTSWKRLAAAAMVGAGVPAAMLLVGVMACGPDFVPEVFVPEHQPESPRLYADGHLGVVQPGYFHAELVVAYRYLSGAKLTDAEKEVYAPKALSVPADPRNWEAEERAREARMPANLWVVARAAVPTPALGAGETQQQNLVTDIPRQGYVEHDEELNCTDAAFNTAIATLAQRTKQWGADSAELIEWAKGQDAVFSNCAKAGATPTAAQPDWSALLRQDRAYQIAAAKFYQQDFDVARDGFIAIGKDAASQWSRWGEYLAARAEVRKAAKTGKAADYGELANFDQDGLTAAEARLKKLETETKDAEIRHAAQAELNFIEVRLHPENRLDEASAALAAPDAEFKQDLADLDFLMDHNVKGSHDLARWIAEMQGGGVTAMPNAAAPKNGLSMWRQQHSLPWLVVAMAQTPGTDTAWAGLLAAAAAVKPDSPGYATVNYRKLELLLAAKKTAEARTLADTVLAGMGKETMASTRNAFLSERMQTARSLAEFLGDAPRTLIEGGSEAALMAQCTGGKLWGPNGCTQKIPPQQFDYDAVKNMNSHLPLALWQEAAEGTVLPKNLRDAVAWAAWMRALGLGDAAGVKQMSALLPPTVQKTAGNSDGFPATLALLRNPGLRPYLEQGVQRSVTYADMDMFRDNWWCGKWAGNMETDNLSPTEMRLASPPVPAFLTAQQKKDAAEEDARLNALPVAAVWLGQRAIAYVKAHPEDKNAAEALGLTVRATHLSCSGQAEDPAQKAVSKEAFEMLHRLYPKSEWALKTKYYY